MLFYDMRLRAVKSVHMKSTNIHTTIASPDEPAHQEPFPRVVPIIASALLLGAGVGFSMGTILTLALTLHISLVPWWIATAQANGHVPLYGWAGLFVLWVVLHCLRVLRG